jgi:hypothetical protein
MWMKFSTAVCYGAASDRDGAARTKGNPASIVRVLAPRKRVFALKMGALPPIVRVFAPAMRVFAPKTRV